MADQLLDNPYILPGLGLLLVGGIGLWAYQRKNKAKAAGSETSFLESRLQPDSFFGASGGQRIDTRDASSASGASSSMSYSLSQLDAIGDVDPVAEADVYLAYGRDLQAEEILKEAMRSNPDRLAIRSKLLEVYAKRRDTKGFEMLASQLHAQCKGEGEDWTKAQELGLQIDPENPLYKPGGRPTAVTVSSTGAVIAEPLGASTQPQSTVAMTSFPTTDMATRAAPDSSLDLDLDLQGEPKGSFKLTPDPVPSKSPVIDMAPLDLPPVQAPPVAPPPPKAPSFAPQLSPLSLPAGDAEAASTTMAMAFDLGDLNLDLPKGAKAPAGPVTTSSADAMFAKSETGAPEFKTPTNFGAIEGDPLIRKIELAEEFRQIGDLDGARDLLEEVVAKGSGAVKDQAESMLARLS